MFIGGTITFDIYYDNWVEHTKSDGTAGKYIQIGRLTYLSTPSQDSFTNDFAAFVPQTGFTEDSTLSSFAVYKERIAFKKYSDFKLEWGHICPMGSFFTALSQTTTTNFC